MVRQREIMERVSVSANPEEEDTPEILKRKRRTRPGPGPEPDN